MTDQAQKQLGKQGSLGYRRPVARGDERGRLPPGAAVKRKLGAGAIDWKWSSAGYYLVDPPGRQFPELPFIHGLPAGVLVYTESCSHWHSHWHPARMSDKEEIKNARQALPATALLHDVGHGPFSHMLEPCLGINHEQWSIAVIRDETTCVSTKCLSARMPTWLRVARVFGKNVEEVFWLEG